MENALLRRNGDDERSREAPATSAAPGATQPQARPPGNSLQNPRHLHPSGNHQNPPAHFFHPPTTTAATTTSTSTSTSTTKPPTTRLPPIDTLNSSFHSTLSTSLDALYRGTATNTQSRPSQHISTPPAVTSWSPSGLSSPNIQSNTTHSNSGHYSYRYDAMPPPDSDQRAWSGSIYSPSYPYSHVSTLRTDRTNGSQPTTSPTSYFQGQGSPPPSSHLNQGSRLSSDSATDLGYSGQGQSYTAYSTLSNKEGTDGDRSHPMSTAGYSYSSRVPDPPSMTTLTDSGSPGTYQNEYTKEMDIRRDVHQAAAASLANLQRQTPISPSSSEYSRPDGRPMLPRQELLDERQMSTFLLTRDGKLPPLFSTPPTGKIQSLNTSLNKTFDCSGRTGINDGQLEGQWPEQPRTVKRPMQADHYRTPVESPKDQDIPQTKKPKPEVKKEPVVGGLVFIGQNDQDASRQVRRHVMKRHRAMQREEREQEAKKNNPNAVLPPPRKKGKKKPEKSIHELKMEAKDAEIETVTQYKASGHITPDTPSQTFPLDMPTTNDQELFRMHVPPGSARPPSGGPGIGPGSGGPQSVGPIRTRQLFMPFEDITPDPDSDREREDSSDNCSSSGRSSSDPFAAVNATAPDPFNRQLAEIAASGIKVKGMDANMLFHHFMFTMPSLMDQAVTNDQFSRIGWLYSTVSILDPNPVFTILGYSSSHVASLHNAPDPAFSPECRLKAIQLINARIQDPTQQCSDQNIGAVLLLLFFELIFCNPDAAATHLSGVRQMIECRPHGYTSILVNPYLKSTILRVETIRAYISISEHRFYVWKPFRRLPDYGINVYRIPNLQDTVPILYENHYCADGLRIINRLESALMRLDSIATAGVSLDINGIRKIILSKVRGTLDLDEDPPNPWSTHISRKVLRLAAIVMLDICAKELLDTGRAPNCLPRKSFLKRFATRYLGHSPQDRDKAIAWGKTIEMAMHVFLMASEPQLEKPWRAFYFADALLHTSGLDDRQWTEIEAVLEKYIENWGWTEPQDTVRSREYFNIRAVHGWFEEHWMEFVGRR